MTAVFYSKQDIFGDARLVLNREGDNHAILDDVDTESTLSSTRNILYLPKLRSRMMKFESYVPTVIYSNVFFADHLLGRIAHLKYVVEKKSQRINEYFHEVKETVKYTNSKIPKNGSLEDEKDLTANNSYFNNEELKVKKKLEILNTYRDKIKALQKQYYGQ